MELTVKFLTYAWYKEKNKREAFTWQVGIRGQSGGDNCKVPLWKTRVPLPLPLPLTHIGWYQGSTHADTNFF